MTTAVEDGTKLRLPDENAPLRVRAGDLEEMIVESLTEWGAPTGKAEAAAFEICGELLRRNGRRVGSPDIVRLSDVEPERVEWIWPGRIPRGRMTILDGDPGLGKSSLTLDLAARVTTGAMMPDGSPGDRPAGVVLLCAEDGLADTIRPRLDAAGADVGRVAALRYVSDLNHDGEPQKRLPTVQDVADLKDAIDAMDAALLVIDPLVAYLGSGVNAHRDQDVRAGLADLADLAKETGVAILAVRHLNKSSGGSPIYRGGGSIGLIAAARSGLLVAPDPDDPDSDRRVLASTKCNLARKPSALAFRVRAHTNGTLYIEWGGESDHDASALLDRQDPDERTARDEAAHVLRQELESGPVPVEELRGLADRLGISWKTLKRAKKKAGVESFREGFGRGATWYWRIEGQGGCPPMEDTKVSPYANVPESRDEPTDVIPIKGQPPGMGPYGETEPDMTDLFEEGDSDG